MVKVSRSRKRLSPKTIPAVAPLPTRAARAALLTEEQVLTRLREEIEGESLTVVAQRYGIRVQQLSDIMYGRASLSKRVTARLRYRLVKLYEKLHNNEGAT